MNHSTALAFRRTGSAGPNRTELKAIVLRLGLFVLLMSFCASLTGCFGFLKPAQSTNRTFVLTAIPREAAPTSPTNSIRIGLAKIRLPSFLLQNSLAVRVGTNEIYYLPTANWAERLDTGFQRVLGADLGITLPTDRVQYSAWQREDVTLELHVSVEAFQIDTEGRGLLLADWRILSPGGERTLKSGSSRVAQAGPPPEPDPSGAISTLSELIADFSRELGPALRDAASANP